MQIHTRSYPFFLEFYNLFYPLINGARTKIIPVIPFHHFDALALAVLAMDDGSYSPSGFYIHTKGIIINDVYRLAGLEH